MSYTSNSQTIDFLFNISDDNDISNCSLIINDAISSTNTSLNKSLVQNISALFNPGSYTWSINCSDEASNIRNSSLRSFVVNAISTSTPTSSSGGGGGGIITKPITHTYIISQTQGTEGYTQTLEKDDKIRFTFFDEKQEEHTLTIDTINQTYIKITIKSDPITLKLGVGQSTKLNLTNKDYYDLFVKLNSIKDNKAKITIQLIHEEINKAPVTGDAIETEDETTAEETETKSDLEIENLKRVVYILVIILIGVIILILFRERKYIKEAIKDLNIIEHKEKFNKELRPNKNKKSK